MRKEHNEQIERWAKFVKENPTEWKKHLKPFLDSQIIKAQKFYQKLSETPQGREKILKLRNIKN